MKKKILSLFILGIFLIVLDGCNVKKVVNKQDSSVLQSQQVANDCEKFWSLKICQDGEKQEIYSGNQVVLVVDKKGEKLEKRGDKLIYFKSGGKLTVIDAINGKKEFFNDCVRWDGKIVCYISGDIKVFNEKLRFVEEAKNVLSKLVKGIGWQKVKKFILKDNLKEENLISFFGSEKGRTVKYIIFESGVKYYRMGLDGNVTGVKLNFKIDKILFIKSVYSPDLMNYTRGYKRDFDVCFDLGDPWPCGMKVFEDYFKPQDKYLFYKGIFYKGIFYKDIKVLLNDKTYGLLGDFLGNVYTSKDSNHYENSCYILIDSEYKGGYWEYTVYRNRGSLVDTGDNCKLEGVTKIGVFREHNGKRDEEYILKSYNPKTGTFRYKISERYGNYAVTGSKYIFRFYLSGGGYTEYVIDFDYLAKYKDFCLRPTKEYLIKFLKGEDNLEYFTIGYENGFDLIRNIFSVNSKDVCLTYGREYGEENEIFVEDNNITLKSLQILSGYEHIYFESMREELGLGIDNYIRKIGSGFKLIKVVDLGCGINIVQRVYKNGKIYTGLDIGLLPKMKTFHNLRYKLTSYNLTGIFYKDNCMLQDITSSGYVGSCISLAQYNDILFEKYFFNSGGIIGIYELSDKLKVKFGNSSFEEEISGIRGYYIITGNYKEGPVRDLRLTKYLLKNVGGSYYIYPHIILSGLTQKDLPIFKLTKIGRNEYVVGLLSGYQALPGPDGICKPAVYFYGWSGENEMKIEFNTIGWIKDLIPNFNITNGWKFKVKDNKVYVDGVEYPYLYYSAMVFYYKRNKLGWIVRGEDVERFFKDKLPKIGFNKKELDDFLEYWIKKYNKGKYYFISFKYNKDFDKYIKLKFRDKPSNIIRVLMESHIVGSGNFDKVYLYPSKYEKYLESKLIRKFKRTYNKEVFEWGGSLWDGKTFWIY